MSRTYSDVDTSADPEDAAAWQERMSTWPAVAAYKRRTYDLLSEAASILDVGCGPGVDGVALGPHRWIGAEPSATMTTAAAQRGVVVCRAGAHHLPFGPGVFGGARADRVFQHLDDPDRALQEMLRVVEPGGRVVIADPDQESLVIHLPGVRPSVLSRLKALRRDIGYRNGTLVSTLPGRLTQLGVRQVGVDAFPLTITDPALAFGLPSWPEVWRKEGGFSDEELREWHAAMAEPQDGFVYLVTFLVVAGIKH